MTVIGPLEVLKDMVARLESRGIEYFLVGSLASMYYGQPRFTNDIDLVIAIKPAQLRTFMDLFPLEAYYCPPDEVLKDEVLRGGSFNLIHQESQIKVDVDLVKPTEFYVSEMKRRRRVSIAGDFEAYVASPEDIILKKLAFYRERGSEKHLADIRGVLAETEIDPSYLNAWITRMGLESEWEKASQ